MTNDEIKTRIILFSGLFTVMLMPIIPIGGGGVSLIFVISVPVLMCLGLIFGLLYDFFFRKFNSIKLKNGIFLLIVLLMLALSLIFYPYTY